MSQASSRELINSCEWPSMRPRAGAPTPTFPDPECAAQVFQACLEAQAGERWAGPGLKPCDLTPKPFPSLTLPCPLFSDPWPA